MNANSSRPSNLAERVQRIRWFHSIDLGGGLITKGVKTREALEKQADVVFKQGVAGKSVIDVGAWDGFFSIEAKRRGAGRVLATDYFSWVGDGWGKKDGFLLAREATNSDIEDQTIDPMDMTLDNVGQFDVMLFLGVLYHLKHPLLALERLAPLCRETMIVESALDCLDVSRPAMAFYPGRECNNDPTNWWGPNAQCVCDMLLTVGFRSVTFDWGPIKKDRAVFHASK